MTKHLGQRLGNYRLMQLLGQGGFAEVYLGEHVFLGTYAAIKLLQVHLDDEEMESFLREARTLAGLTHPNILRIIEFGVENNIPYLVMDYASNGTLRQRHPRGSILPISLVLFYIKQIASALQYLHSRKLIHRDIKPENLLLGSNNEVLISDFGTATVFETLQGQGTLEMAGTLTYMAPEQIRGKPRPASDQYGLAIVVYEWLAGAPPFKGVFTDLYNLHMFVDPPSLRRLAPEIPPELEEVVMTALAKDPDKRFANISAFANALEQASKRSAAPTPPRPLPPLPSNQPLSPTLTSPRQPFLTEEDGPTVASRTLISGGKGQIDTPTQPAHQQESTLAPRPEVSSPTPPSPTLPPPAPEQFLWPSRQLVENPERGFFPPVPPPKQERHLSRRTFALGLVGVGGVAAAGGLAALIVFLRNGGAGATGGASTPTPTLVPGTTFVVYKAHTDQVYTLGWTPIGNYIASGGKDDKVRVWRPTSPVGSDQYVFLGQSGSVNALTWSPDGKLIASGGSDMQVLVWDALSGNLSAAYRGHKKFIRTVAWSPDGRFIASGGDDNTVQVWEAATGTHIYTYTGHTGMIWSVAWFPFSGSMRIVSASADKTVHMWDATTGLNVRTYSGHASAVKAVAWSPDGQYIASGSDVPESTVHVWNVQTLQPLLMYSGHTGGIYAIAWSPKGQQQYIASSSWQEVRVWTPTLPNGKTLNTYSRHMGAVHTIAWSPDGQRIASGADDTTVRIWQAY